MIRIFLALWLGLTPALAQQGTAVGPLPSTVGQATTGQIPGTATNDAATAGKVGELLEFDAALGGTSVTSNTAITIISGSLTAGDWEVTCTAYFLPAATTTITGLKVSLSTTDNTLNNNIGFFGAASYPGLVLGATNFTTLSNQPARVSLASPTTYYCVVIAIFAVSTMGAGARLHARRAR